MDQIMSQPVAGCYCCEKTTALQGARWYVLTGDNFEYLCFLYRHSSACLLYLI